ncbi:hypothetical protein, partial [Propionicicella superfundia]|uniref:hypothetical protein n=1 Tax=Propionicicella superfundia TaxID=348582 RepID=UPI000490FFE6
MTTGKGTRHASVRTAAALSATLMLTTACSVLPGLSGDLSTNGPCPDGWKAAVLWSTENGTASTIDYIKPDNTIAQQHLPWIGLTAGPGNLLDRRGDDLVTVTNGNMDRDKTHIVTLSTTACSLSAVQIPEPLVLGVGTSPDATFTTNGINGAGWVHRHDLDGKTTAEVDYPNVIPSKPVWHDGTLSVFAEELAEGEGTSGTPLLLVLDDRTMKERARLRLPSDVSLVQDSL